MKKYRIIIVLITVIYVILALGMNSIMKNEKDVENNQYRVEINRLYNAFEKEGRVEKVKDCLYVKDMEYLPSSISDIEIINNFYSVKNGMQMEIVPVVAKEKVTGYLRFDYIKNLGTQKYVNISQACLAVMYAVTLIGMLYTYRKIIKPFHILSNMPYELSRGNLNDEIKESKNRYFGKFVWGIGMLKDSLENHKQRELKLAKDKKMLLLSISHDIKTPLNAINLYAKALEQGIYENEEEKMGAAKKIQEKTVEINEFVKEIMKSSMEDVIEIEVADSEFYLGDFVNKITTGYSEKCKIHKTQFDVGFYENHLLKGDIDRLFEAFGNLIENAFKYGDGKNIAITFTEEEYCELIKVYNSGTVISDNDMVHLFDSFYRGSNSEGKQGNGLGLYICREIMNKMKGDIYAKQAEGGMEFVLVCRMS